MDESFIIPVISPWYHLSKKQPKHQERVLLYCPKFAEFLENPLLGFQLGRYNADLNQFSLEWNNTPTILYDISYWARLSINKTTTSYEDQLTVQLFNMLGVKIDN